MLSDEEKEALEILEDFEPDDLVECSIYLQALEKIKSLIEKQQKEIEELKNEDLTTVYLNGFYDGEKKVKDKIKAKIEEIDIEIQCCEYADDDTEEYKKDMEKEKRRLLKVKKVLQSLLEKE